MKYQSTRSNSPLYSSMEVIKKGIADDGGLFVPTQLPVFTKEEFEQLDKMNYQQRAVKVLSKFLTDYDPQELEEMVGAAYNTQGGILANFRHEQVAPMISIGEKIHVLELHHGPTFAFKDMALQILPRLVTSALDNTGEDVELMVLTATSGDTGKAALEGFRDIPGTQIVVFYPRDGVSYMQKKQMVTQMGSNTHVIAVEGNFDDARS